MPGLQNYTVSAVDASVHESSLFVNHLIPPEADLDPRRVQPEDHSALGELPPGTETRLRAWGGRSRTQKCRRKLSL
jgi:hypothetical protein